MPHGIPHLRAWREHRKMTQDQLAAASGKAKPYISQVENGHRGYTQPSLEALAAALDITPAQLLGGPPNADSAIWEVWNRLRAADRPRGLALLRSLEATGFAEDAPEFEAVSPPRPASRRS